MTRQVLLRPKARSDLDAIWAYTVSEWSQPQAVSYLTGLDGVFRLIAEFPELARERAEFTSAVRIYPYRRHLVIYTAQPDTLDVLRILGARSDWVALLNEGEGE